MEDPQLTKIIEQLAGSLLPPCSPYCKNDPVRELPASEHGIRSYCAQQRSLTKEIYFRYLAEQIRDPEYDGHRKMFVALADEQARDRRKRLFEDYTAFRANHAWENDRQQSVIVDPTDLTEPNRINEWSPGNTLHETLLADMAVPQKIVRQSIIDDSQLASESEIRLVGRRISELANLYLQNGQDLKIVLRSQISNYLQNHFGRQWINHVRQHYQNVHRPVPKYKSLRTIWYQSLRHDYHYLDKLSPDDAVPFVNFSVTGDHVYLLDQKLHLSHSCTDSVCRDFFLHLQSQMPNLVAYDSQSHRNVDSDPRHAEQVLRVYMQQTNRSEDGDSKPGADIG